MSTTDSFAPLMTTDDCLDPTAVAFAGSLIFACLFFLFINYTEAPKFGYNPVLNPVTDKYASINAWLKLGTLLGLLSVQIAAWVSYRIFLADYNFAGYIFPRDILALPLSCLTFVYVAMNVLLPSGLWMAEAVKDKTPMAKRQKEEMRLAMYYFTFIYWVAFYTIGGAMSYRSYLYLAANTANDGTYPTNFHALCGLALAMSLLAIVGLWVHFENVYSSGKLNELVGATRYHGFVGLQTIYHELDIPFMFGTCCYTGLIYVLNYKDYYQFSAGAGFVVLATLLGTFLSKNVGTFSFYHALSLWVATTVSYVATDIAASVRSGNDPAQWGNPGANIGLMQLNISEVVTAESFPVTMNLLTGLSFVGLFGFGASTWLAANIIRARIGLKIYNSDL